MHAGGWGYVWVGGMGDDEGVQGCILLSTNQIFPRSKNNFELPPYAMPGELQPSFLSVATSQAEIKDPSLDIKEKPSSDPLPVE